MVYVSLSAVKVKIFLHGSLFKQDSMRQNLLRMYANQHSDIFFLHSNKFWHLGIYRKIIIELLVGYFSEILVDS
jgi:hypothetical protein